MSTEHTAQQPTPIVNDWCALAMHADSESILELAKEMERALKDAEYMGNLLAIIHGDGGHYRAEHGTRKATDDAITIVIGLKQRISELESECQNHVEHIAPFRQRAKYAEREVAELKERFRKAVSKIALCRDSANHQYSHARDTNADSEYLLWLGGTLNTALTQLERTSQGGGGSE